MTVLFALGLVLSASSAASASDDHEDMDRQNGAQSEAERTVTAKRGPPEPVPVFSRGTVSYQLVAGPSMMAGVGALGVALLGVGHAAGADAAGAFVWPGAFMLIFAPPAGATIGTTWVGRRRYNRGSDNLMTTVLGAGLGWTVGMGGLAMLTDEDDDIDGDFVAMYFAATGAGSLIGSIVGYHLGQMRANHRDQTDIRRWSTIEIAPLGLDGGTTARGVMLRASGRF